MSRQAVLVGINNYPAGSGLTPLTCAERDVHELAKALRSCGFELTELVGSKATSEALYDALHAVRNADTFLFFFAGHGQMMHGNSYRLHPYNSTAFGANTVPFADLVGLWRGSKHFSNVLSILDACRNQGVFADAASSARKVQPHDDASARDLQQTVKQVRGKWVEVLYGCGIGEFSYEDKTRLGHGVLSAGLLHVLRNGNDFLDSDHLLKRTCDWMRVWCEEDPEHRWQQPETYGPRSEHVPIVLREGAVADAQRVAPPRVGRVEIVTPQLHVVTTPPGARIAVGGRDAGLSPLSLALGPGQYTVSAKLSGHQPWHRRISFDGLGNAELPITLAKPPTESRAINESLAYSLGERANRFPERAGHSGTKAGDGTTMDISNGVKLDLVWIPPGTFMMGSPDSDEDAIVHEKPQHRVKITQGFWMGKYPVTQAQWAAVMGKNPSYIKGPDRPVENVSWNDCQGFLEKLNTRGDTFSLPTEAQWEYACRAGSMTRFFFGDNASDLGNYAWHEENSGVETHPVGRKQPNAWGLHDMHGNVWEWCRDWYYAGFYGRSPNRDPENNTKSDSRVLRGGSWLLNPVDCRAAARNRNTPDRAGASLGFRVLWTS